MEDPNLNDVTVIEDLEFGVCPHSKEIPFMGQIRNCLLEEHYGSYHYHQGGSTKKGYYRCSEACWRELWRECPIREEKAPEEASE